MEEVVLKAQVRQATGKGAVRRLRAAGQLPAVIYGEKVGSQSVVIELKAFEHLLHHAGENAVFKLDMSDAGQPSYMVMVKELQREPVRQDIVHADLFQLNMKHKVRVNVSIHLEGDALGVKEGGVIQHQAREIEVECLPADIPEYISVDISNLNIGDSLYVKDLEAGKGEIITEPDEVVVTIVPPAREEDMEEAPEEPGEVPVVEKAATEE